MEDLKAMDIYDVMEEKLKDDARSLKTIKNLGKELIEKMKLIDAEINSLNPERTNNWNTLADEDRHKLIELYKLKGQYRHQFDMITVILNKSDVIVNNFTRNKFEEVGLDDRFFVKNLEE